jgi:ribosomal protein L5
MTFSSYSKYSDFTSRFFYKNPYQIPQLQKISLSMIFPQSSLFVLSSNLFGLQIMFGTKPQLIRGTSSLHKRRKTTTETIGYKLNLNKKQTIEFIERFLKYKVYFWDKNLQIKNSKSISFFLTNLKQFSDIVCFFDFLEHNKGFLVTCHFSSDKPEESAFILSNFKFPIQ